MNILSKQDRNIAIGKTIVIQKKIKGMYIQAKGPNIVIMKLKKD